MGALVLFGVPPEEFWPYAEKGFDYFSLDPPGTKPADLIERVKTYIVGGLPSMFGFTVYSSP